MTVLEILKVRWQGDAFNAAALESTIPYFDVVNLNVELNTMPEKWAGAVVQEQGDEDLTMGSNPIVQQTGFIAIGLFAKSGEGGAILDAEIRAVKDALHGWASDGLEILHVDGPLDVEPFVEGNWYQAALQATYTFTYRRAATGPGFGDLQGLNHGP